MSNQDNNPKPRSTSLSNEVNKTYKSAARVLFHDDYLNNNTLEFEGNFKGANNAVQYKSIVDVNRKEAGTTFVLNDEARLDFALQGDSVFRLKLKSNSILNHLDFNHHAWNTKVQNTNLNFWFNPYVQYQENRDFTNGALFLGLITNLNNGVYSINARVKLQNKGDQLTGEFENNWTVKHGKWAFNWYYTDDIRNWSRNVTRKLTAEYLGNNISVSAELDKNRKGDSLDWNMDSLNVGVAYHHNKDLTCGLWSATNFQKNNATVLSAALNYKAHHNVNVKAKADTNQDVSLFANYNWAQGVNLQLSLQSSADAKRIREVFNNSFKFGLKLKYDS